LQLAEDLNFDFDSLCALSKADEFRLWHALRARSELFIIKENSFVVIDPAGVYLDWQKTSSCHYYLYSATLYPLFSDYRRWCSQSWITNWSNGGRKLRLSPLCCLNFKSSMGQLLPNLADSMCWTPMELYVWHSSPMLLPFPSFGLAMVPAELSNFTVWLQVLGHTLTRCIP